MRLGFWKLQFYLILHSMGENKLVRAKCVHCPVRLQNGCQVNISKVVLWFWNFGYDFLAVGGDVWRWLCRHTHRKISASVNGGPSGGSSVRCAGPVARTPIGARGNLLTISQVWRYHSSGSISFHPLSLMCLSPYLSNKSTIPLGS